MNQSSYEWRRWHQLRGVFGCSSTADKHIQLHDITAAPVFPLAGRVFLHKTVSQEHFGRTAVFRHDKGFQCFMPMLPQRYFVRSLIVSPAIPLL